MGFEPVGVQVPPPALPVVSSASLVTIRSPSGAVAQLAKAPVSKTGDSRFESWLPRLLSLALQATFPLCRRVCGRSTRTSPEGQRRSAKVNKRLFSTPFIPPDIPPRGSKRGREVGLRRRNPRGFSRERHCARQRSLPPPSIGIRLLKDRERCQSRRDLLRRPGVSVDLRRQVNWPPSCRRWFHLRPLLQKAAGIVLGDICDWASSRAATAFYARARRVSVSLNCPINRRQPTRPLGALE